MSSHAKDSGRKQKVFQAARPGIADPFSPDLSSPDASESSLRESLVEHDLHTMQVHIDEKDELSSANEGFNSADYALTSVPSYLEPRFGHNFSRIPIHAPVIQAQLAINQPGDEFEQEAERISHQVTHMPEPQLQDSSPREGAYAGHQVEQAEREPEHVQVKPVQVGGAGQMAAPPIVSEAVYSPGQPLDSATRAFLEPRFGHDFGQVRVHSDATAGQAAREVHARAYTVGNDIVFGAGQYTPHTSAGRQLLAHEITHVVQQSAGLAQSIQRDPDDPTKTSQTTQPGTAPAKAAAPDPDAVEAAARAVDPFLPQIDLTQQTPLENDAAAQQLVLVAFGGEKGLNDAFETLSPEVKKQVDADATADVARAKRAGQTPDADQVKTANRAQFLARVRLYFNSWAEVLDHFRAIEQLSDGPVDLFLHRDAKARLQRVLEVLKSKGHALPTIHEGFSLRHKYRSTDSGGNPIVEHPGMMIHLMGYAFDASAKSNPRITYGSEQAGGLERHDQDLLAVTVGPAAAHMDLGKNNPGFIEAMGKRTAGDTVAATDDTDPAAVEYFERFAAQFNQMVQGSQAFTHSLSTAHRDELLKIRNQYFDELRAIRDERKKGAKADAKIIAAHEAQRRALLLRMPALMTEWIAALDKEINAEFAKHPGMSKMRSPAEITRDLKSKQAEVQQATREEAQAQAAKAQAMAARDAASAARDRAEAAEHHAPSGQAFQKAWEAAQAARQRLSEKMDAVAEAIGKELDTRHALEADVKARDALATELKASDAPALRGSWAWIERLRELRQALAAPDLSTPAGLRAYERLTTGDLSEFTGDAPVDNPPLLRLLDIGYFNPSGAFDLAFFEEAAHSGFWPGASWNFGSVDSMHFELAEGRNSLQSPGKTP